MPNNRNIIKFFQYKMSFMLLFFSNLGSNDIQPFTFVYSNLNTFFFFFLKILFI